MMNRLHAIALLLLIAACQASPVPPPLAGAAIGGPFTLVDQNGAKRTDRDFTGKYRIMYFGYTYCPDVCPVDMAHIAAGYHAFAKAAPNRAARTVPVFVSVDPDRDDPATLKSFVAAFGPEIVGLTGTTAQIDAVAKAYGVVHMKQKASGGSGYLVNHSRAAYLMDPEGKPLALLSHDARPEVIAHELETWVK